MPAQRVKATFSIVAVDQTTGEIGCAVQSKYFAVGTVVPWVKAGIGAVASQAAGVAAFGPRILGLLEHERLRPQAAVDSVLGGDDHRETRQLGVVRADGAVAAHTGRACTAWAGHRTGVGFAVQGNILAGEAVVAEMARVFVAAAGSLAERLVASLAAGQAAGGDSRDQQSAAVVVERPGAAAESREGLDRICDLRVDDHPHPITELEGLLETHLRWDAVRRASVHFAPGRYEHGIAILQWAASRFPDDAVIHYDLACFHALGSDFGEALAHLRAAIELDPGLRAAARADRDFAAFAGEAGFRELLSVARRSATPSAPDGGRW
jgi:uncharacterized Ntn-hydrolase superfamily protein